MIVYEILDILAIVLTTISITVLIFTARKNKVLPYFITCQIFLVVWTVCHLLETHCKNILQQIIINDIGYFAVCFIGATFFLFTLYYTNSQIAKNKFLRNIIYLPSVILYFFMITNPIFHLYFEKYKYRNQTGGIGFYLTIAVTYFFIISGIVLLLYKNIKTYKVRKLQVIMIILATTIPIVVNFLSVVINHQNSYDLTPVSFSVSSILIILAIYRYDFMDVSQNGIKQVIDKLNQHIIIFNEKNTVTYVNKSFVKTFKTKVIPDKTNINNLLTILLMFSEDKFSKELNNLLVEKISGNLECYFCIRKEILFYHIEKSTVYDNKNKIIGYIISMTDVTEYHNMLKELENKNIELSNANSKLIKMNLISQQLAVERERRKIAQNMHDTLGHSLVSVMTLIKLTMLDKNQNSNDTLNQALTISENLLNDVRTVVSGLSENKHLGITEKLKNLIDEMGNLGNKIELTVIGTESEDHYFAVDAVFVSIREAITNAFRHGNATKVDIILKFRNRSITIFIIDNGCGCEKIEKDIGLKGIEERINQLGGKVLFSSVTNDGFNVHIEIPVRKEIYD